MPCYITSVSAHLLHQPLRIPYELSFGRLSAFDSVIVRVVASDGRVGFGESCPVPPYSHDSVRDVWGSVIDMVPRLVNVDCSSALRMLLRQPDSTDPFAYVAPATAVESLVDPVYHEGELSIPIVGSVMAHDGDELISEVQQLVNAGYRTLKVKVGFDPATDARRVAIIGDSVPTDVQLRLDANGAWNPSQAREFLERLEPSGVELLEQPFPRDRWDWTADLADESPPVPLMLDESIQGDSSVKRAADIGVSVVKLKLMKAGSRAVLRRRIRLAAELSLSVVVGNGIAGVVDNWYESVCASDMPCSGEMNGSLKLLKSVFSHAPSVSGGQLTFPKGFRLDATEEDLLRHSECAFSS